MVDRFLPLLPADQDGWLGEFFGGRTYPLLWKEGEVYLLPLTEDDIGFYKAPGEFGGGGTVAQTYCLRLCFSVLAVILLD